MGNHSRITLENEKNYSMRFPAWIYFIDVLLGRLDCNGDSNLIFTSDKKIIPIDFNLICTWAYEDHPWFIEYSQFNFEHVEKIKKNKNYRIIEIIKKLKPDVIWNILYSIDKNNQMVSLNTKKKYLEGILYRRDNLVINH